MTKASRRGTFRCAKRAQLPARRSSNCFRDFAATAKKMVNQSSVAIRIESVLDRKKISIHACLQIQ